MFFGNKKAKSLSIACKTLLSYAFLVEVTFNWNWLIWSKKISNPLTLVLISNFCKINGCTSPNWARIVFPTLSWADLPGWKKLLILSQKLLRVN